MSGELTDRYFEIFDVPEDASCIHCGGSAKLSNPMLAFSAAGQPTISVHHHCYIHWAFQELVVDERADVTQRAQG